MAGDVDVPGLVRLEVVFYEKFGYELRNVTEYKAVGKVKVTLGGSLYPLVTRW